MESLQQTVGGTGDDSIAEPTATLPTGPTGVTGPTGPTGDPTDDTGATTLKLTGTAGSTILCGTVTMLPTTGITVGPTTSG